MYKNFFSIKNIQYLVIFGLILTFIFPLIIKGNNDLEEYSTGLFSNKILWSSFSSFFINFYDFYGAGTKFPLGNSLFFHPYNFFIENIKIYYFLVIFTNLYLSVIFFSKCLKKLNVNHNILIFAFLLIFSFSNFLTVLSDDWLSIFFSFSFFPVVFYYFIKVLDEQYLTDYLKLSIFLFIWIVNGHLGHSSIFLIFLLIYTFFSLKNFQTFFDIINYKFFFFLILLTLLLSSHIFFLTRESLYFEADKSYFRSYQVYDFLKILYPFKFDINSKHINRLPGNAILIYSSLIFSIFTIINFLKNYLTNFKNKNISQFINHSIKTLSKNKRILISCLFLGFIFLSAVPILKLLPSISAVWFCRDVSFYLSIIIFFYIYNDINKSYKFFFSLFAILYSILFFIININLMDFNKRNNFIKNEVNNSEFIKVLKDLKLEKNDYSRIYLSKKIIERFTSNFHEDGILAITDLINYNLSPFQGDFKNVSMKQMGGNEKLMHGNIPSKYEYINNENFLNLFHIKYVLINESEISKIENEELKLLKSFDSQSGILHLYVRKISNLSINKKKFKEFKELFEKCNLAKIDCLLENENFFNLSPSKFDRVQNAIFEIKDLNTDFLFLPFLFDKSWSTKKGEIINLDNSFMFFKNSDEINKSYKIFYKDNLRTILKLISLISFVMVSSFIIFKKIRNV